MSTKKNRKPTKTDHVRAALMTSLRADVATLVERGDSGESGLDSVLESVGYHCVVSETNENIGRAIVALAPLLDLDVLANVVHAAAYHRVVAGYYHDAITSNPDAEAISTSPVLWEKADEFANSTLAGIDGELFARFRARIECVAGAASTLQVVSA